MINALTSENYKDITKISILDAKVVFSIKICFRKEILLLMRIWLLLLMPEDLNISRIQND
jgi:hypothetical protein